MKFLSTTLKDNDAFPNLSINKWRMRQKQISRRSYPRYALFMGNPLKSVAI